MVHVILDNYAAHKHPKVRAWLDRHERFTFHFTPTSCSWLNAVEGFFAKLTARDSSVASSTRWLIFRPPSTATLSRPTPAPSRSPGRLIQTTSPPPSGAGTKC